MSSWFSGTSEVGRSKSQPHSHSQSHSTPRRRERTPSPKKYFVRPHNPSSTTGGGSSSHERGRRSPSPSVRGLFTRPSASSSSYYKRRPRDGFIHRMLSQLKRMLRGIYDYARQNPMKLFMLVIMPLITGGALTGVLKTMGIGLPAGLPGLGALMGGFGARGGVGGDGSGDFDFSQGGMQSLLGIAKMFL
ncbi:hypothetical protein MMC25_007430 [Agyrium rufum]|nr:hypothetical protein [Agyrium rufum]